MHEGEARTRRLTSVTSTTASNTVRHSVYSEDTYYNDREKRKTRIYFLFRYLFFFCFFFFNQKYANTTLLYSVIATIYIRLISYHAAVFPIEQRQLCVEMCRRRRRRRRRPRRSWSMGVRLPPLHPLTLAVRYTVHRVKE